MECVDFRTQYGGDISKVRIGELFALDAHPDVCLKCRAWVFKFGARQSPEGGCNG